MQCSRVLYLVSAILLLIGITGCAYDLGSDRKAPASQPSTHPVRGDVSKPDPNRPPRRHVKGEDFLRQFEPTPAVVAHMKRFQDALAERDWTTALNCCSDQVRVAANAYPSPAEFFHRVVPVEKIVALYGMPICGSKGRWDAEHLAHKLFINLVNEKGRPTVQWTWWIEPVGDRYQITFDTIPLDQWIAQETERKNKIQQEDNTARARLEPKLSGISTRLTSARERFRVGEPIYFRLELVNDSKVVLTYDDQQVHVNGSMKITDAAGQLVPTNVPCVQTAGGEENLPPSKTAVLFDQFDISTQYPIKKHGRYKVQFNGHGLEIWITGDQVDMPQVKGVWTGRAWPSNEWRFWSSNTVEIVVE